MSLLRPSPRSRAPTPEAVEEPPAVVAPQGTQQDHFAELERAWVNACEHPSEGKVQERFRERYRDYRDRYLTPGGAVLTR